MRRYLLVVDPGREEHIARHHVTVEEVEELLAGNPFARKQRQGYVRLTGQTSAGRYLSVFIAPRGGQVYGLVTARDATSAERRACQKYKGR